MGGRRVIKAKKNSKFFFKIFFFSNFFSRATPGPSASRMIKLVVASLESENHTPYNKNGNNFYKLWFFNCSKKFYLSFASCVFFCVSPFIIGEYKNSGNLLLSRHLGDFLNTQTFRRFLKYPDNWEISWIRRYLGHL